MHQCPRNLRLVVHGLGTGDASIATLTSEAELRVLIRRHRRWIVVSCLRPLAQPLRHQRGGSNASGSSYNHAASAYSGTGSSVFSPPSTLGRNTQSGPFPTSEQLATPSSTFPYAYGRGSGRGGGNNGTNGDAWI